MRHDPTKVQRAISNVTFPATPEQLVHSAEERGADPEILQSLASLPDELYNDADAVMSTLEDQVA